jgi:phosphinothricin acetyltransferase
MNATIRTATSDDAPAIADIYNQAVLGSTASFDVEPKSVADRRAWLADHDAAHPVLVAEDSEDQILAWGSLSRWSERPAYDATVEISIYVDAAAVGRGLGSQLMDALLDAARAIGHHSIISRVCAENDRSLRLGERYGFREVGVMRESGRKFDRWLDVVMLEKLL